VLTVEQINLQGTKVKLKNRPISIYKIQPKTKDLSTRLWGIKIPHTPQTSEFEGFIPQSLVLRSIVQG